MSAKRPLPVFVLALLAGGVLTTACAKRPTTTMVSAPPPTAGSLGAAVLAGTPAAPASALATPAASPAPATAQASRPAEFEEQPALADVYFDFDRAVIRPGDARVLDKNAAWLLEHPEILVLIEGHCDERGTYEYNIALGERRARAARNHLMARGVSADRIATISYGKERPTCTVASEACWSRNRRAHFLTKSR